MNKKSVFGVLIGFLVFSFFLIPTKASIIELFSFDGYLEYQKNVPEPGDFYPKYIKLNISFPVRFQKNDKVYWEGIFDGECDGLDLLVAQTYEGGPYPFYSWASVTWEYLSFDICHQKKCWTVGNLGDTIYTYLIVKTNYDSNGETLYKLHWKLYATRPATIPPEQTIGINVIPFLFGFMSLGIILIYKKVKHLGC